MNDRERFMSFFKPGVALLNPSSMKMRSLGLGAFVLGSSMLGIGVKDIDLSSSFTEVNQSYVEIVTKDIARNNALEIVATIPPVSERRFKRLKPLTVSELKAEVEKHNINLDKVKTNKVFPAVKFDRLPKDLSKVRDVNEKKRLFITAMLPSIIVVNKEIEADRVKFLSLIEKKEALTKGEDAWLLNLASKYKALNDDGSIDLEKLMYRVDKVPISLTLAQAAIESGWGTSRFAKEGNALFGQWTWNKEDKGIVPNQRSSGKTHRIKAFDTLEESVRSYIMNLNTHSAYFSMREKRKIIRDQEKPLKSVELAQGLLKYSERGSEYVSEVKSTIEYNKFSKFDNLNFSKEKTFKSVKIDEKNSKNIILGDVKDNFENNIVNNNSLEDNVVMNNIPDSLVLKLGMKAINFEDYKDFLEEYRQNDYNLSKIVLNSENEVPFNQIAQKAYVYGLIDANDPRIGANVAHLTPFMHETISPSYIIAQHKDEAVSSEVGVDDVVNVLNTVEKNIDSKRDRDDHSYVRGLILFMKDNRVSNSRRLEKIAPALEAMSVKEYKKGNNDLAMNLSGLTEKVVDKIQINRRRENQIEIS